MKGRSGMATLVAGETTKARFWLAIELAFISTCIILVSLVEHRDSKCDFLKKSIFFFYIG